MTHAVGAGTEPSARVKAADVAGLYDVAISFTARDEKAARLADELARELRRAGVKTFYFRNIDEAAEVLGDRLSHAMPDIYENRALVVVLVGSEQYGKTHWTGIELEAALRRPADDSGRTRIVPISADGARIERLPEDVIALTPETVKGKTTLQSVVQILLARCGKRRRWIDRHGPWLLALFAIASAAAQLLTPGALTMLDPWMIGFAIAGVAGALIWWLGPPVWMALRRRNAQALAVVSEGKGVRGLRSGSALIAGICAVAIAALATAGAAAVIDARLRLRDVETLVSENAIGAAFGRFEGSGGRLDDFRGEVIAALRTGLQDQLSNGGWREFPALYPRFMALTGKADQAIEETFLTATGVGVLKPGDDVEDHVAAAFALRGPSPRTANRLLQTAFARRLEWLMSGNAFYYDGERPWSLYRKLTEAEGRTAWMQAHTVSTLTNTEGLAPDILVQLAVEGDVGARKRVLDRIATGNPDGRFLYTLAAVPWPEAFADELAPRLRRAWDGVQAGDDSRARAALAVAIATVDPAGGVKYLLEKGAAAEDPVAFDVAAYGLRHARAVTPDADIAAADAFLARVKAMVPPDMVSFGLVNDVLQTEECASDRCRFHPGLAHWRVAAGEETPPARPFDDVLAAYVALGAPAGDSFGAIGHAELLREMGRTGNAKAVEYLRGTFDTLAHGNMRLAAIESLFRLTGAFEARSLEEMTKLANMDTSIYRPELVRLLASLESEIHALPMDQQAQVIAVVTQITTTGDGYERGMMLKLLAGFDAATAERRALNLAASSQTDDQLEGIEILMYLWRGAEAAL